MNVGILPSTFYFKIAISNSILSASFDFGDQN